MTRVVAKKLAARMQAMSRARRLEYLANLRVIWQWRRTMHAREEAV